MFSYYREKEILTVKEPLKYIRFFKKMSIFQRFRIIFHAEEFGFAIHISPKFTAVLMWHDRALPFPRNLALGKLLSMSFNLSTSKMSDEGMPTL